MMIAEYNVTLENKTKSELILFIEELQKMLKEKDKKLKDKDNKIWQLKSQIQDLENECISLHELIDEGM